MKIQDRKYTTKTGLESLQRLIKELNGSIHPDIETMISSSFPAYVNMTNGKMWGDYYYLEWVNSHGFWKIKDGELYFVTEGENGNDERRNIAEIFRLNFPEAIRALAELVEKYNKASSEKDEELEAFFVSFQQYAS